jgi:hypothetical protein
MVSIPMVVSVLHFFTSDDQARRIIEASVDALPSGSNNGAVSRKP